MIVTDTEGAYSMDTGSDMKFLCEWIRIYHKKNNIVITCATSGIGGCAMQFLASGVFSAVNCVEKNQKRFEFLKTNLKNVAMRSNASICPYHVFFDSYVNIWKSIKNDIIYFDPPWGGIDYYKKKDIFLHLDGICIASFIMKIFAERNCNHLLIILKTPKNWSEDQLQKINSNSQVCHAKIENIKHSYYICLLYTSPSPRDQRGSRMPSSA